MFRSEGKNRKKTSFLESNVNHESEQNATATNAYPLPLDMRLLLCNPVKVNREQQQQQFTQSVHELGIS